MCYNVGVRNPEKYRPKVSEGREFANWNGKRKGEMKPTLKENTLSKTSIAPENGCLED